MIYGGQNGTGVGFSRVLQFPLKSIPSIAPQSSSSIIISGWYNRPVVASVIVDTVPLHPKKQTKIKVTLILLRYKKQGACESCCRSVNRDCGH
jgi:hypothetical protein